LWKMQGIPEAREMDDKIRQMLAIDPINKDNAPRWLDFAKKIRSTCNMIEAQAQATLYH